MLVHNSLVTSLTKKKHAVKSNFLFILILFLRINTWGQNIIVIDKQTISNGKLIQLTSNSSSDLDKRYALKFINTFTKDTVVNYIDSVRHAHCSPPNSIFFINDSTGFFTESGGCYACYDWLFRTTDRGLTWDFIESGSRTSGNSMNFRLNNQSFYMFNELQGIIIWELKEGELFYSLSSDGGINWEKKSHLALKKTDKKQIQNISFSADGQVTIICSDAYFIESDRKRVEIIQSNNYGKSFEKIK